MDVRAAESEPNVDHLRVSPTWPCGVAPHWVCPRHDLCGPAIPITVIGTDSASSHQQPISPQAGVRDRHQQKNHPVGRPDGYSRYANPLSVWGPVGVFVAPRSARKRMQRLYRLRERHIPLTIPMSIDNVALWMNSILGT
jgi:hypothetical protein